MTRKRAARARGTFGGRTFGLAAIVDESAGYHARNTSWRWSAGVGTLASGEPVTWNLVEGIHDAPEASERTVWVAGEPREVAPVAFNGLRGVGGLRFRAVATRAARELRPRSLRLRAAVRHLRRLGARRGELREGSGVTERHDVRW